MMMNEGLSAGDILALTRDRDDDRNDWMDNPFIYLVWMWMFGNNGFGRGNLAAQESLT
jgi:hypothetical protein